MELSVRAFAPNILVGLALLGMGCTQSENDAASTITPPSQAEIANDPSATPVPVASLALPNGSNLEFFDFESGVLITESGLAGTPRGLTEMNSPHALEKQAAFDDRLGAIWRGLANGKPVPKALLDIQERWRNPALRPQAPIKPVITKEAAGIPSAPQSREIPALGKTAAPNGCNNGCCDYEWLSTFHECKGGHDYSWFLYNYGYSYANIDDVDVFEGLVCAATGNSTWKVRMGDGKGGTWTITPAHYKTWWWVYGWFDEDLRSSVNTSTSQALHTYCGVISD